MVIDEFLPKFDFNEVHKVKVNASPEKAFAACREMQPDELSPLVFWMLNVRSLPAMLAGKGHANVNESKPFLEQLYKGGFIPLAERNNEIVFGMIGQFWKLTGGEDITNVSPQEFKEFKRSDFAKVAANLLVTPEAAHVIVSTETRIWAPDVQTRKKFAFYWRLISFGSGWIRLMWLHAIKRRAER